MHENRPMLNNIAQQLHISYPVAAKQPQPDFELNPSTISIAPNLRNDLHNVVHHQLAHSAMDPLSIASGVAGLLTVSAAVIKTFDTVKTSIENCPRTVFWAHAETKEINWAIRRLKSLIDDPDSVPKAAKMSVGIHDATVTISELIKTCDHLITTLKPLDKDGKVVLTRWDRVKWLRVQDDVVKYIRQLQAHKGSVTLILNILQWQVSFILGIESANTEKRIDAVLNSSEATQRRIEGLEALFNKFIADNSTLIPSNRLSMAPTLHHWKEDDTTETDSVATSRKYDQDEWGGFHASAERSLSFPTSSVPELGMPKLKRSTSAETSTKSESNGTTSPPRREFEVTLENTDVYKRVYNSTDAFSIHSTHGRSMTGSVMTSFSLADDSSILSAFPIMSRTELQHPEFYTQISGNQRISRDLMRAITTRSVVKSPVEPPPGAPFSLKQFRSPPNCGENVMGRWHQSRTKAWRPKEFRTEIQFEVPIIFVTTSKTAKGPIVGADVFFIDGTRKSLDDTWTDLEPPSTSTFTKTGRFIKNERATWLALLSSLQKMENESQNWTRQQIMSLRPRPASATAILTSIAGKHTLNAALQREKKSWDDMPPSINRPYATTTMSSLIEMLAMLGIYWKDFNTFHNVYQAEGNGFLVKGHKISGLGIMFHFQALEKAVFEGNRTIPTEAVTRLAFGQLPTIFTEGHPGYKGGNTLFEWPNVGLGSRTEIAETLSSFGCGRKAVNYFLRDGAVTSHIFPVTFELIGMIGQVFHIKDLCFRNIPNPCYCVWGTRGFSPPKLLAAYQRYLHDDHDMANGKLPLHLNTIFAPKTCIRPGDDTPQSYTWQAQDALHSVLNEIDESLKDYSSPKYGSQRASLGQEIIGAHFEELLCQMNIASAFPPANASNKEGALMKAYFQQILPAVLRAASMKFFNLKNADSEFQVVKGEAAQTAEYAAYLRAAKEVCLFLNFPINVFFLLIIFSLIILGETSFFLRYERKLHANLIASWYDLATSFDIRRQLLAFADDLKQNLNSTSIFQEFANSISTLSMSQPNPRAEGAIPTVIKIEDGQDLLEALQDREKKKRLAEMERRVMEAFEKVKPRMCDEAVKETQAYLDQRDWEAPASTPQEASTIQNFLVMQAIWPENHTVFRIAVSFAKYWKCGEMVEGPEHYPMLKDTAREMKLFGGELDMSWREWRQRDHWFAQICEQRIEEEEDADADKPEESKGTNNDIQTDTPPTLDELETAAEMRVKRMAEKLQKAKEGLRRVQKRKRDTYKAEAELRMKTSEALKSKAAKDAKQAATEKAQAEWNAMMAKKYASKLGVSSTTAPAASSSGERRPGDGHLDKRQRTGSKSGRPL
ncbi:modin [Fusarium globosum]|uniref:Modin n=1 Tax=Fusarium globosum TaxID=78864 RepID=A0A8H5XYS0_9HYPO|nr:modin [Fusarium globosum]